MNTADWDWGRTLELLSVPLLRLGSLQLSALQLVRITVLGLAVIYAARLFRRWMTSTVLARTDMDIGSRQAMGALSRYVFIVAGFMVVLQTAGVDLTVFNVLAGTVGIGIGFGLQNVASNFISGLIILFEGPVRVGDRIEVGAVQGDVVRIGPRSTVVVTNDNIAIIVPNSKLISENVINWSHGDPKVRFKIPVTVAAESDPRQVEKLLLEVAAEEADVLKEPAPGVRFLAFAPDGYLFELRAWSKAQLQHKGRLTSALNFGIHRKFKEHGIETPFPQREVRIRKD